MKHLFSFSVLMAMLLGASPLLAQDTVTELADPKPGPQEAWQTVKKPQFVWGSADVRYSRSQVPDASKAPALYAWRGERVSAQAVFATPADVEVTLSVSDLKSGKNVIPSACIRKYFVSYVLTDYFGDRSETYLMPDRLVEVEKYAVPAQTTRPVWLDIHVPQDAAPGKYTGRVSLSFDGTTLTLPLSVNVGKRVLPEPKDWAYHLDLWQNPYSVARYFNVPLWSQAHFDAMRPIMELYAQAGGKVITTSIIQHPWNGQTEDPFESMVVKMKHVDGSWTYDYTVFDKWVEFMMSCGVTEQIDCYTIVPWGYKFEYVDMATSTLSQVACVPGEKAYEDFILPFLTDFARHLKTKGWFERTCIAMDERPMDQLRVAWDIVRRADPNYRIEGAVNYSPEVVNMMYDISIAYDYNALPDEVVDQRHAEGKVTKFYTCCGPDRPNTFTFSPAAESAYLAFHAAALNYDGYLRWAYNSWVADPCTDTRFRTWYSGDCFVVYPSGSSIRFEQMVRGIQDYEKIRILRAEGKPGMQEKIDALLQPFAAIPYATEDAAVAVAAAEAAIRRLE